MARQAGTGRNRREAGQGPHPRRRPLILVAGAGPAGLAAALALRARARERTDLQLCDSGQGHPADAVAPGTGPLRVSAIAPAGQRLLARLGVWDDVAAQSQPILGMTITDSRVGDVVRPAFLDFAAPDDLGDPGEPLDPREPLAWMVPDAALTQALARQARAEGIAIRTARVTRADPEPGHIVARLDTGDTIPADLVIAADGARSRLRGGAGIGWIAWDYPQSGIVATIHHERPHGGQARQHFLPAGPFARLPLADALATSAELPPHRSSIVWSESRDMVAMMLSLSPADLLAEIERRFGLDLGTLALDGPARAYPLAFGLARRFGAERLALVGDAAHQVHPLAGQGLNLGLGDAAALADAVADALALGLDPGDGMVLDAYERARRADVVAMGALTDALNRLFSNDLTPLRRLRDLGLGLVDRWPRLKDRMISAARGETRAAGATPVLMRR